MAFVYGLKLEDESAYDALRDIGADMDRIRRKVLSRIGAKTVSYVQREKLTGNPLGRRSGHLAQGLHFAFVGPFTILVGPSVIYGAIHEYGGVIHPVNAKALRFIPDGGGEAVFAKEVTIPARPWLEPGMAEYLTSAEARNLTTSTLQAELDRHGSDHGVN